MKKEFENISEEVEILMALRLSGEISEIENQKLEDFFKSNPNVKEQFLKNKNTLSLLNKTTQELPAMQLSGKKRGALLQLSQSSSKSGRNVLVTYVVAATAFFTFMIGLYLYTDKTFQDHNRTIALNSDKKVVTVHPEKLELAKQELQEETLPANEALKDAHASNKESDDSHKRASIKSSSSPEEKYNLAKGKEKSDAKQFSSIEPIASDHAEYEFGQDSSPVVEGKTSERSKSEELKRNGAKEKTVEDNKAMAPQSKLAAIEAKNDNAKVGGLSDASIAKPTKEEQHLKSELDSIKILSEAASDIPNAPEKLPEHTKKFEYEVSLQFNQKEIRKKIVSSIDLSNVQNRPKIKFQDILEYADLNITTVAINELKDRKSPQEKVVIQDQNATAQSDKLAKTESNKAEAKKAEMIGSNKDTSALAKEIVLISESVLAFQKRNSLDKKAKKDLLESIKSAMNTIAIIQKDDVFLQWLETIEKELKQ